MFWKFFTIYKKELRSQESEFRMHMKKKKILNTLLFQNHYYNMKVVQELYFPASWILTSVFRWQGKMGMSNVTLSA